MMRAPNCCTRLNVMLAALKIAYVVNQLINLYLTLAIYFPALVGLKQTDPENTASSASFSISGLESATDEKKSEQYAQFVELYALCYVIHGLTLPFLTLILNASFREAHLEQQWKTSITLQTSEAVSAYAHHLLAIGNPSSPQWTSPFVSLLGFFSAHATYKYFKELNNNNAVAPLAVPLLPAENANQQAGNDVRLEVITPLRQ